LDRDTEQRHRHEIFGGKPVGYPGVIPVAPEALKPLAVVTGEVVAERRLGVIADVKV
jgi:hypothetical protein